MSNWKAAYFCKSCGNTVSWRMKMDGNGVCPHCGTISDGTIVDTFTKAYRKTRISPWWKLWDIEWDIEWKDEQEET